MGVNDMTGGGGLEKGKEQGDLKQFIEQLK